jgi:hypothetical protein
MERYVTLGIGLNTHESTWLTDKEFSTLTGIGRIALLCFSSPVVDVRGAARSDWADCIQPGRQVR